MIKPVSAKPRQRHLRRYRYVDETPDVELDSRIAGAAATQARPERRGARAVGERRQAGQAAAQAAPRCEATGRARRKPKPMSRRNRLPRRSTSRRRESLPASKPEPPPLAPIGRRERSHLSRGRKEIDARLDLHGMTQTRAHRALFGFLQRAHHDGLTFVLIITGKGKIGGRSPSAACCAVRCRNGSACRNSARWWSASRKPISAMAARARCMCGCGGRESSVLERSHDSGLRRPPSATE